MPMFRRRPFFPRAVARTAPPSLSATVEHSATGALTAQAATVSGAALHPHTSTGALEAQAAAVAGSATLTPLPVTHATMGALVAGEATISGGSVHTSPNTAATGGWDTKSKPYSKLEPPTPDEVQAQREAMGIVPKRPKLTKPAPKKPEIPVTTEVPPDLRGKDLAIWIELLNQDIKHGADIVPPQQLDLMQRARAVALQRQEEEDIAFVLGTVIAAIED